MNDEEKNEEIMEDEIIEETGLQEKLKKLREELKICHSEKSEYLAGWQRAKADFINARKDDERGRMEFAKYAAEKVLREMLAVADSLELSGSPAYADSAFVATSAKEAASAGKADGKIIYNQFLEILKKEGVILIEANGKKFDPYFHEALEQVEVGEKEKDGLVLEELQKGYMIYDRVLRPSKVKVGHYKLS